MYPILCLWQNQEKYQSLSDNYHLFSLSRSLYIAWTCYHGVYVCCVVCFFNPMISYVIFLIPARVLDWKINFFYSVLFYIVMHIMYFTWT